MQIPLRINYRKWRQLFSLFSFLLITACSGDNYETGNGDLSYLTSELVEAHTISAQTIDYVLTDDGKQLSLVTPLSATWATEAGKYYRALLYYQPSQTNANTIVPYRISQVSVLQPKALSDLDDIATDPITLESAWLSKNKKYLNLRLALKTADVETQQSIGLLLESDNNQVVTLQLLHNQNNVPQYYSVTVFRSIALTSYPPGTTIILKINTYKGIIERQFTL